jgi:hypothetical protein
MPKTPNLRRRLQTPHALGRERRRAEGAQRRRTVHTARLVGRIDRTGDQDASAGGVGVRSRRGPELQKKTLLAEEQTRPDVARKRARWKTHQGLIAPAQLVFIDETWVKTNMAPLRGWGTRGRRLKAYAPHGRWKTLTFIAALRHDRIDAPWVIDGPISLFPALEWRDRLDPRVVGKRNGKLVELHGVLQADIVTRRPTVSA